MYDTKRFGTRCLATEIVFTVMAPWLAGCRSGSSPARIQQPVSGGAATQIDALSPADPNGHPDQRSTPPAAEAMIAEAEKHIELKPDGTLRIQDGRHAAP